MNPLRVWARHYRTFDEVDVQLPTGCVAILGPNGAGKSSLLNLVDVALFADRGELAPLLTVGEEELEVGLLFEHANELYRVRRQFSARGRGKTTCDVERYSPGAEVYTGDDGREYVRTTDVGQAWMPLTRENAGETNQLICDTLGLTRPTFRASAFLRQGDGAAFTEAQPRDRKAILAEILGLEIWDRLAERARADLRAAEDEISKTAGAIEAAEQVAANRPGLEAMLVAHRTEEADASAALAGAELELEKAQQAIAANMGAVERVRAAEAELAAAEGEKRRARELVDESSRAGETRAQLQRDLGEVSAQAERVDELEKRAAQLREADAAAAAAMREREAATRELDRLDRQLTAVDDDRERREQQALELARKAAQLREHPDVDDLCDRCGQHLGAEARTRAADSYMDEGAAIMGALEQEIPARVALAAQLQEADERVKAIVVADVEDPEPVERELALARRASERRAALVAHLQTAAEKAALLPPRETALRIAEAMVQQKAMLLASAREGLQDPGALDAVARTWRDAIAGHRARLDATRQQIARAGAELDRCATAEQQLVELRERTADARRRVDVLHLADRAFGRDGIPALIVENAAVPQIELEANRILSELGTPYRVELRTLRALKSDADKLRDTLDIVIVDGSHERPYETFSGGERTRLNLALRIALARLLAHRRGAESRLLAVDEPEYLDDAGTQQLAEVLRGLQTEFDRVLLVSHVPSLAASFDQTISVVKDGDVSRVDVGVAEAVAA